MLKFVKIFLVNMKIFHVIDDHNQTLILNVNLLNFSTLDDDLDLRCSLEPDKLSKIYHG